MDVWFAATQFQKHKGVPPYEDFVHPAVSARTLPYVMQMPTAFVPWDDKSGVIGIRRHDKQLAICRCGIVLAGIYFQRDNANQGQAAVALKAMDKNQIMLQRDDVESEIRVMAQLQIGGVDAPLSNPYVIRWEHGEDQYNHYLATEYVSNGSLVKYAGKRIRQLFIKHLQAFADTYGEGPTKLECISYVYRDSGHEWMREGLSIFQGIMRGLTYLHAQSVAHLDLDIYNVAIDTRGIPRIIDFGSSLLMDNRGVVGAGSVGIKCKPTFVAPELQSHSKIPPPRPGFDGAKADMWSAGVIVRALFSPCVCVVYIVNAVFYECSLYSALCGGFEADPSSSQATRTGEPMCSTTSTPTANHPSAICASTSSPFRR